MPVKVLHCVQKAHTHRDYSSVPVPAPFSRCSAAVGCSYRMVSAFFFADITVATMIMLQATTLSAEHTSGGNSVCVSQPLRISTGGALCLLNY